MKIIVLGADGYLGWPTCMRLAKLGHEIVAVDNYYKRHTMKRENLKPLRKPGFLFNRVETFKQITNISIQDILANVKEEGIIKIIKSDKPDAIIHYAEQPSAPYSMIDKYTCIETFTNNIIGTLNILWAIRGTDIHLIKLGTMGEYGTPGIHIDEGWLEVYNEETLKYVDLPFPKLPGSFYHASKVADSVNLEFACRAWDICCTDLNQGIVYGIHTDETKLHDSLFTTFHYDSIFGTALNRFITQAVCEQPITVYGQGGQTRGWLNIEDTLQCIEIALNNPAKKGQFKVRNQFTEIFSVTELAEMVKSTLGGAIQTVSNPRVEQEKHYYSASNQSFLDQGLEPKKLTSQIIEEIAMEVEAHRLTIRKNNLFHRVDWR